MQVKIHYHRPPDRTTVFENELVHASEDVVITISEDDAAAVDVVITARKKVSGSATEVATTMIDLLAKGKQVVGKQQNQFGDQAQSMLVLQDGNNVSFYLFVANTKTNSLRIGTFTCPLGRMDEIGQKAQTVMNHVIWVE